MRRLTGLDGVAHPVGRISAVGVVFHERGPHKSRSPARQLRARLHTELAQKGRDVELHGADRYIQFASDFFVGSIAQHRVQHFPLARAQRRGAGNGAPFLQQLLCSRNQAAHQRIVCGNHYLEFRGILTPHQALHRKQAGDPLNRAFQVRAGCSPKLRVSGGRLAEKERIRDAHFLSIFLFHELWKNANFSQISLPVRLAQDCMRQSFFDFNFGDALSLERCFFTAAKERVCAVVLFEPYSFVSYGTAFTLAGALARRRHRAKRTFILIIYK
jgi:hypothetical protein